MAPQISLTVTTMWCPVFRAEFGDINGMSSVAGVQPCPASHHGATRAGVGAGGGGTRTSVAASRPAS
jgi:hypothetical protein